MIESQRLERPTIGLVVPCFNEEQALPFAVPALVAELESMSAAGRISEESFVFLVDDGSVDNTWQLIQAYAEQGLPVAGLKLSRNFGHQHALMAGLLEADADYLVSLDADLQDDIGVLPEMLAAAAEGSEIVYAVRNDRTTDTRFKRWTAGLHYRLSEALGIETIRDHADFRLMSRRAIKLLRQYRETNLYLRGIIPQLGLATSQVLCKRNERVAGESKYTFWPMLSLSLKGLTSFSVAPLRFIALMGILILLAALILGGWVLYAAIWVGETIPGWASTVLPIYLLGGLQLFAIGIVGEYIGKIYIEVKRRPMYLLEERCSATHINPHPRPHSHEQNNR